MSEHIETGKYLRAIAHSDEYIRYRQRAAGLERTESNTEKMSARKHAIAMGALALANHQTKESGYRTPEGTIYALIGRIDAFSHAQSILDSHKNLSREQKRPYKETVIAFNHALKEAIDRNPSVGFDSMLRALQETYASMNGTADIITFTTQAREALVGMQHERATEQIIGLTEGYEVAYEREVGIDDELGGFDLYVRDTTTGESFGVDVKASERSVARARAKAEAAIRLGYDDNPDKYITSGCKNSDFGNSFTIPLEVAESLTSTMQAALDRAAHTRHYDPSRQLSAVA